LREHAKGRADAKEKRREEQSGIADMFQGYHADVQEATIDTIVSEQKKLALDNLLAILQQGPLPFSKIVIRLLEAYMLRETNVKDICVELAATGKIERTWGGGNRKPSDDSLIKLKP
jgi:restriction endonuclease Mrr